MKILIVSSIWPHPEHSTRAANIVIYQMLAALAAEDDVTVGLLVVGGPSVLSLELEETQGANSLSDLGVTVLEPLDLGPTLPRRGRIQRLLSPSLGDWYPQCRLSEKIGRRVEDWAADVILVPWSEWLTHACSDLNVDKFAYYGNPDPKAARVQLSIKYRLSGGSKFKHVIERLWVSIFERLHLAALKKYKYLGNVALNDAKYYEINGHTNAFYIQSIWAFPHVNTRRPNEAERGPFRIVGSIGKVNGTANTLGLEYLRTFLMPELDMVMKGMEYEVHIFGAGVPNRLIESLKRHPKILWRGFVTDIDQELLDSDVFLCVNNATEFKVQHTRYLHAWSLGIPVVAHVDAALSMPELIHGENCLLGHDQSEIAKHLYYLHKNPQMRKIIGDQGKNSFARDFTAEKVSMRILQKLKEH